MECHKGFELKWRVWEATKTHFRLRTSRWQPHFTPDNFWSHFSIPWPPFWNMAATPAALPNVQHCCKNGRCFLYFFELFQAPLQQLWKMTRYWTKTYKDSITAYGFVKIFIHGYPNIYDIQKTIILANTNLYLYIPPGKMGCDRHSHACLGLS